MATEVRPLNLANLQPRLLSLEELDQMKERGIISTDERVELLDGVLIAMSAVGGRHARVINRMAGVISRLDTAEIEISVQNPMRIGDRAEFLPDVVVLKADPVSNTVPTAEEAQLVIEVADSSRNYDRTIKAPRYAAAGIPEMILVDLVEDRLIGYSEPREDGYRRIHLAGRGEQLASTVLAGLVFDVDQILGPKD